MMDHDELVPYEGEYVPLDTLDGDQIHNLIVSLEFDAPYINSAQEKATKDMISGLRDELRERGWRPDS